MPYDPMAGGGKSKKYSRKVSKGIQSSAMTMTAAKNNAPLVLATNGVTGNVNACSLFPYNTQYFVGNNTGTASTGAAYPCALYGLHVEGHFLPYQGLTTGTATGTPALSGAVFACVWYVAIQRQGETVPVPILWNQSGGTGATTAGAISQYGLYPEKDIMLWGAGSIDGFTSTAVTNYKRFRIYGENRSARVLDIGDAIHLFAAASHLNQANVPIAVMAWAVAQFVVIL